MGDWSVVLCPVTGWQQHCRHGCLGAGSEGREGLSTLRRGTPPLPGPPSSPRCPPHPSAVVCTPRAAGMHRALPHSRSGHHWFVLDCCGGRRECSVGAGTGDSRAGFAGLKADQGELVWPSPEADALRRAGGPSPESRSGIYLEAPLGGVWAGGPDTVPWATLTICRRLLLWDWHCQEPFLFGFFTKK